jgi:hypothetical protein
LGGAASDEARIAPDTPWTRQTASSDATTTHPGRSMMTAHLARSGRRTAGRS